MTRGRPLRFLGAVLAGWTGLRIVMLWPEAAPISLAVAPARAAVREELAPRPIGFPARAVSAPLQATPTSLDLPGARWPAAPPDVSILCGPTHAPSPPIAPADPAASQGQVAAQPVAQLAADAPGHRSRLAGDAWMVLRPSGDDTLAFGQLGGSQGGARITYALDGGRHLALSARLSAPVRGRGTEAAIGIDLRPTALPLHVLIEERLGLDGGGTRPAVGVIAGASAALPLGARLDAYGQVGAVSRRGGFADGAALLARPVFERHGARVEIGGGAGGAAQRRASRLDLGPSAALVVPAGGTALRLQFDYRARVAGSARPGSGPALTLGGSF